MRRQAYSLARLLGDLNAIRRGTIHKRLVNKVIGRKIVAKLWWR